MENVQSEQLLAEQFTHLVDVSSPLVTGHVAQVVAFAQVAQLLSHAVQVAPPKKPSTQAEHTFFGLHVLQLDKSHLSHAV